MPPELLEPPLLEVPEPEEPPLDEPPLEELALDDPLPEPPPLDDVLPVTLPDCPQATQTPSAAISGASGGAVRPVIP
jgi:hypothetical protein